MAGIYIHIPFCRQACHYCDFHFSTQLKSQDEMVKCISQELDQRSGQLAEPIRTVYFGGGTPSLLSAPQLDSILASIKENYVLSDDAEITLEANPEDINEDWCKNGLDRGVNRLSIGVQTFNNERLSWMNRIHDAAQAEQAVNVARMTGFRNISLDLIYAIPNGDTWESDMQRAIRLSPNHISLYGLTIEEKTVFGNWERNKKLIQVPESEAAVQYLHAIDFLHSHGYEQYEVANFAQNGFYSRHNQAYWSGVPYLGVGPGAHSYLDGRRSFNVRNNAKYIQALQTNSNYREEEVLSSVQQINETILTRLRTISGLHVADLRERYDYDIFQKHASLIARLQKERMVLVSPTHIRLLPQGFLVADEIAVNFFLPEA